MIIIELSFKRRHDTTDLYPEHSINNSNNIIIITTII
jgi:hypothetical protein